MSHALLHRIHRFNASRVQAVLPLKYAAMRQSAFHFFRGTAHLFYEDLAQGPPLPSSPTAWLCGDLHLENFGSYRGRDGLVYFDENDFDEAVRGPVLLDLARLLTSVLLSAADERKEPAMAGELAQTVLQRYTQTLLRTKAATVQSATAKGVIKDLMQTVKRRRRAGLLRQRTTGDARHPKLLRTEKLLALPQPLRSQLCEACTDWFEARGKGWRAVDAGFRIAGTGSIGVRRYGVLLQHREDRKRLRLLDVKEALPSSAQTYLQQPSWRNEAERIVQAQTLLQHVEPARLSTFAFAERWFVVKELQPTDDKVNLRDRLYLPGQLHRYHADIGRLAASAHLRSSGHLGSATADELQAFAAEAGWQQAVMEWSTACAEKTRRDYALWSGHAG